MKLRAVPKTLEAVNEFITAHHRHNKKVTGHRFSTGAMAEDRLVGVGVLGRTTARALHDETTAEVTRVCVLDDAPKGTCSFLYASLWRAWRALGGTRLVTYTLQSESGASLRGAGWTPVAVLKARNAAGWANRMGREVQQVVSEPKIRWEVVA